MTTLRELNNQRLEKIAAGPSFLALGPEQLQQVNNDLHWELNKARLANELQAEYGVENLNTPQVLPAIIADRNRRAARNKAITTAALGIGGMAAANKDTLSLMANNTNNYAKSFSPSSARYRTIRGLGNTANAASVLGMAGVGALAQQGYLSPENVDTANLALAGIGTAGGLASVGSLAHNAYKKHGFNAVKIPGIRSVIGKGLASAVAPMAAYALGKYFASPSTDEVNKLNMLNDHYANMAGIQPEIYK